MASKLTEILLGIDVGSVSTKMVVLDAKDLKMIDSLYIRTHGDPLNSLRIVMKRLAERQPPPLVKATATTGNGRNLAARLVNTEIVRNEITTHTLAAVKDRTGRPNCSGDWGTGLEDHCRERRYGG